LWKQVQKDKDIDMSTDTLEELEEQVENGRIKNMILTNVFQSLIIESGVNWAQDEELQQIFFGYNK